MSTAQVQKFYEAVESNDELRERLLRSAEESEMSAVEAVVRIANEYGFDFLLEELQEIRNRRVERFPGIEEPPDRAEAGKSCCHWASDCMPGFSGGPGGGAIVQPG